MDSLPKLPFFDFWRTKKQRPKDQLPDGWRAERFKIFDGGDGRIGIKGWNNQCLGDSEKGKTWKRKVGFSKKPWIFRVQLLFSLVWECFFDQGDKSLRSGQQIEPYQKTLAKYMEVMTMVGFPGIQFSLVIFSG